MKWLIQRVALATVVGAIATDGIAQSRPATTASAATARAEWRAPISKRELSGKYNGGELYAVEFLNHNIGWAVGGQSGTKSTMLFGTKDGGKTWERQTLFDGELSHLTDIGFADANNGWIIGSNQVLRTTDGGESWGPVNQPERGSYGARKLLVLGPDAIIVGSDVENAQILRTVDGGGTWEVIALVKDGGGGAGSNSTVSGLALAEPSTIFATTGTFHGGRGVIYRSNDGGRTWEVVEEADRPLLGIAFRGRRGVAVGSNIAFWTEDGGNTWRRVAIPGSQQAVDFADDNTVVAVGGSSNGPWVVISRNGGKTWQPFNAPHDHGNLVDIEVVDPGWWFVAGGYGARALYHYVDPNHTEPIATGTIPIPVDIEVPGGRALPRGVYEVTMGHRGDQHVLKLDRKGDARPAGAGAGGQGASGQSAAGGQGGTGRQPSAGGQPSDEESSEELDAAVESQKNQKPPACAQPCVVTLPSGVTYEKEDVAPGAGGRDPKSFLFRVALEPTPTGVAVVVRTAVTPPRNIGLALAAVAAPQTSDNEVRQVAKKAADKGGGLFGRIKKAAAGDIKGAVEGAVNPQATQQRLRAAKSAPPAVYKVTLRHPLNLFGPAKK